MHANWNNLLELVRDERGQDLIEYALLAAAGSLALAAVMPNYLLPQVSRVFSLILSQAAATCSIG